MLKVKLGDVFVSQNVFPKLLTQSLKLKTLVNIERLLKKLNDELQFIENQRNALIKKHGNEIINGEWKVPDENLEIFTKEFSEILDVEIELAEVEKLNVDEISDVMINAQEYQSLKPFINL